MTKIYINNVMSPKEYRRKKRARQLNLTARRKSGKKLTLKRIEEISK